MSTAIIQIQQGEKPMTTEKLTPAQLRQREENKLARANATRFYPAVADAVHYPSVGMELSRFGQDKGPVKRDTVDDYADVDGHVAVVSRVRDGLDKMRQSGHISDHELDAAREFQQAFRACGYDRVKTSNLSGVSGGGSGMEDHIVRTTAARNQVYETLELVGGPLSPMWRAVYWVVGCGISLNEIGKRESGDVKVWSGFVRSALYLMGQDYQKRLKAVDAHRSNGKKKRNV